MADITSSIIPIIIMAHLNQRFIMCIIAKSGMLLLIAARSSPEAVLATVCKLTMSFNYQFLK